MRALVTGATGFIGEHVARRFLEGGTEVFALVRPPASRLSIEGVTAVGADLTDRAALRVLDDLPDFDVVCHLAADTRMDAGEEVWNANVHGTANLLGRLGPRLAGKRFLFASSIAAVDRTAKPRRPLTTEDRPAPRSVYAKSKLRGEELLAEEAAARGFSLANLRLATIYGPGQESGGVVTLAKAAKEGGLAARLPWPGKISFCYVGDVAEVFWRLASAPEAVSGTYFVAEDRGFSMAEAAAMLREIGGGGKGPMRLAYPALALARFLIWLPVARGVAPWSLRAALSDTILCDSDPIRRVTGVEWTPLRTGLERTFG